VIVEVKVPRLAESISDATLVEWLKGDGEAVRLDEPIATLETDKAAVEISATESGVLRHARPVGDVVHVDDVLARIEAGAVAAPPPAPAAVPAPAAPAAQPPAVPTGGAPAPPAVAAAAPFGPAVRRLLEEHGLDPALVKGTGPGGRLLKEDVLRQLEPPETCPAVPARPVAAAAPSPLAPPAPAPPPGEGERVVPMSRIRLRIAERLVQAQHTAAILTTFNEVDMSAIVELRARRRAGFEQQHGIKLGMASFFARAAIQALREVPELNAEVRGTDIVYHEHVNLSVAVQTDRGLVVPVIHGAHRLCFVDLEREIARLAAKARDHKLSLDDLAGGTFTVSNGGIFGSLFSTPILNPPQSGILGMHKIEKRPVVVSEQVAIRPMMYVALSYDHRLVDGEQSVTFLVKVKERLEDPERLLLDV
jgi:2-oxoglutarate dehydrogenase E2 component (dihydrolipoamide succinyltransferase)